MKRILGCAGLIAALALPLALKAQDQSTSPPPQYVQNPPHSRWDLNHATVGVYGDMFRVNPAHAAAVNFLGLGARVGFNVHPNIALEAEMNYDFVKNYTTINTGTNSGSVGSTTVSTRTRPLTGLFGPKFQFGTSGPFRAFVTGKVGFTEFSHSSTTTASGQTFSNSLDQFGGGTTHFAAYPGGGIEGFFGPIGLRLEAGDQIYFNNGAYNNLRVTFGPEIRF
ncbi:hypothetical protein [Occallatibacter savannae]|uniref:hypothetical protein n=1 Tax=Occallatibacter savannae TaxID=1002691 RepID=UPI000D68AD49|nr:hypothetical protein [Occallatibacter savannae]